MKIVFLVRALVYGGAERQLIALAKGLHERGHDVNVVVFYGDQPLDDDLRAAGVPLTIVGKRGRWDIPVFLVRLARTLRSERPDIVHGYLSTSNTLGLLLGPFHRGRVVWGIRASDMDQSRYNWLSRLDARVEGWLARFPDLIIANSRAGRDDVVAQGYPKDRVTVIPNGIDTDRFRPDPEGGRRVRRELGIAPETRLVGRVGRLDPQKDYPTFLRACAMITAERPAVRFLCVGEGPKDYERQLVGESGQLGLNGAVIWTGARPDMPAVYSALDVAVSSSAFGEGLPNVVAEAMACGVPGVVTDVGDSAWTVGETGEVVPAGDSVALAAAMGRLLDAPRQEADGLALRQRVVDSLSLERLFAETESALSGLLDGRRR